MDAKITLSFNAHTIEKAKRFAEAHNMSLSRLTEFLYQQLTTQNYKTLEELPIAEWVTMVSEGQAEYHAKPRGRKAMKNEFFAKK
ncbi:MAG: DUF6364 family protein [Cyclobacteriaceae bacterium]|jgi:hypothetical protein|nr:DUF6364 family protein [Cyclobacteriaceae bacterium]